MIYLYLWFDDSEINADVCLDDTYEVNPEYWTKLGPFESDEEASNSWILLGRKTGLLYENDGHTAIGIKIKTRLSRSYHSRAQKGLKGV